MFCQVRPKDFLGEGVGVGSQLVGRVKCTDIETWTICSTNGKPVPMNSMFWVRRTNLHLLALDDRRLYSSIYAETVLANFNPLLVRSEDLYIKLLYMTHVRQAAFCTRGR
jgi:hypothetical protein